MQWACNFVRQRERWNLAAKVRRYMEKDLRVRPFDEEGYQRALAKLTALSGKPVPPDVARGPAGAADRELIVGSSAGNRLLIVSFIEGNDKVRIITARRATKRERQDARSGC